jgi:hypothetical protein
LVRERLTNGLAEEDRALAGVCESDADDFDDAMVFGVCHKIDGGVYHSISADDLPPDEGLEAVPLGFWMLDIDPLVGACPVGQLRRGEFRTIRVLSLVPHPVPRVPGDRRAGFGFGPSPGAGLGLLFWGPCDDPSGEWRHLSQVAAWITGSA